MVDSFPPARAFVFDMDGLLIDSEPFWRSVETAVFAAHDIDITPLIGRGLTKGMRVDHVVAFFRTRLGFVAPSDEELVTEILDGVSAAILAKGTLKRGALDALSACESLGASLALATGSMWPVVDAVLERTGLAGRFRVVASAADDELGKPHPSIFLRTATALGLDPIECVVLEDSLHGCIAAKAARMRVIAVPEGPGSSDPRFAIADVVLSSLTEFRSPQIAELVGHPMLAGV